MPRPAIDWIISDLHWHHDKIIELCGRPVDHMELSIKNMRHLLAPQDRLFNLGDVMFYKMTDLKGIMDSIPGKKILIMGNHDHQSAGWYGRNGFDFVADAVLVKDIYLTHKPSPLPKGARINIHGHWHNLAIDQKPEFWTPQTHRLFSLERERYKPRKLCELILESK